MGDSPSTSRHRVPVMAVRTLPRLDSLTVFQRAIGQWLTLLRELGGRVGTKQYQVLFPPLRISSHSSSCQASEVLRLTLSQHADRTARGYSSVSTYPSLTSSTVRYQTHGEARATPRRQAGSIQPSGKRLHIRNITSSHDHRAKTTQHSSLTCQARERLPIPRTRSLLPRRQIPRPTDRATI